MDPPKEIKYELPVARIYNDGSVERLVGLEITPPGTDPTTKTTSRDVTIDPQTNIRARIYTPESATSNPTTKLPVLLFVHGGGFVSETPWSPTIQPFLNTLSSKADTLIVSVDYRLAPESPIPGPYEDSYLALQWVVNGSDKYLTDHADFTRVFLAGDSAGANIVHNVAMRVGEFGFGSGSVPGAKIEGLILIQPFFWGTERMGSEMDESRFLKPAALDDLWRIACGTEDVSNDDPRCNPFVVGAKGLGELGCQRVLVTVGGKDVLRDRGRAYYERLGEVGGWEKRVEFFESEGEDHIFYYMNPEGMKTLEFIDCLAGFIRRA